MNKLEIKTAIQVLKPIEEVFEAIINPEQMTKYFIAKSSGRLEEGKTIKWKFPEFDMEFPVRAGKINKPDYISFYWATDDHVELMVEIILKARKDFTLITVSEKSRVNDDAGIKWLRGNTEGWANFLACLKAWLEYGINLRKGAFDFMSEKQESDNL